MNALGWSANIASELVNLTLSAAVRCKLELDDLSVDHFTTWWQCIVVSTLLQTFFGALVVVVPDVSDAVSFEAIWLECVTR